MFNLEEILGDDKKKKKKLMPPITAEQVIDTSKPPVDELPPPDLGALDLINQQGNPELGINPKLQNQVSTDNSPASNVAPEVLNSLLPPLGEAPLVPEPTSDISTDILPQATEKPPLAVGLPAPVPAEYVPQSQQTQQKILDIQNKDYGQGGADRDKKWSFGEKLAGIGLPLLDSVLSGRGLLGGIPGAIQGGTNRNFLEQREDDKQLGQLLPQLAQQRQQEQFQGQQANQDSLTNARNVNTENAKLKPYFDKQKIDLSRQREIGRVQRQQRKFEQDIRQLERKAQINGQKWKIQVDEETGLVSKIFPNDAARKAEPFINPNTGKQYVSPSKQVYDQTLPDGRTIKATGGQIMGYEGRKAEAQASRDFRASESQKTRNFQRTENAKQRKLSYERLRDQTAKWKADMERKYSNDQTTLQQLKVVQIAKWKEAANAGRLSEAEYTELVDSIN